ncbi:MAG: acetylglutamate kinase [Acidobacteria bacterium]|nr:acetylglutamate kinase [Acidobacteriota bacterium]
MKAVIKIGGTLLESAADRLRLAKLIGQHWQAGHQILLVHGGGKQLTQYLEKSGIASQFVEGLRVTTEESLDGVVKVFAGTINHQLLAAFHQAGVPAAGISGIDGSCLLASKRVGQPGQDWGYVGQIQKVNPLLWETLLAARFVPVLASLAVGENGQVYNVNADQVAVTCAIHLQADCLVFLTDVDGVQDAQGRTLTRVAAEEIPVLLHSGAVSGGMLAKLNTVQEALAQGVERVVIANGHRNDVLNDVFRLFAGRADGQLPVGTVVTSSPLTVKRS